MGKKTRSSVLLARAWNFAVFQSLVTISILRQGVKMIEGISFQIDEELEYLLRILIAGVLGFFIGLERSKRQKEAGLRTHFIVSAGAALMMCISLAMTSDPARIAAQIVSGIGFLGAGMIFFKREALHGLTTAAGIWFTAGVGMAIGSGMYVLGCGATVVVILAQVLFHNKIFSETNNYHLLLVKFDYDKETLAFLKKVFKVDRFSRFKAYHNEKGDIVAEAVIRTRNMCTADELATLMTQNAEIRSIERLEDW